MASKDDQKGGPLAESDLGAVNHIQDASTKDFCFQQVMLRIKDPRKSVEFYTKVLGMTLLGKRHFEAGRFSLYWLGYAEASEIPKDEQERFRWFLQRKGTLELTHNWGTEVDPAQQYHNGNTEPRGYGHISITLNDVFEACKRFEKLGVTFVKKPDEGAMKGIAFIQDPDGYIIEFFNREHIHGVIFGSKI